jgi:replicative DNA helicase
MPDGDFSPLFGLSQRLPPSNTQAEQALLGAILMNNKALERCGDLQPEHFIDPAHVCIFREIKRLAGAGRTADAVTLKSSLEHTGALDDVGGTTYLTGLYSAVVGIINAGDYARAIRECWMRRQLIDVGETIVNGAFGVDPNIDIATIASNAVARIDEVSNNSGALNNHVTTLDTAMDSAIEAMEAARTRKGPAGISTGFRSMDNRLGGLEPGLVYVIAGRPGMGKAQPLDAKVLLESGAWCEMGQIRVGQRIASTDGAPSRVLRIHERGERETFRVTFSDDRSTVVCGDHLWRVKYRDWPDARILSTDSVRVMLTKARYKGRLSIDRVSGNFGSGQLPLDPYVLGVLLGDGCMMSSTPKITSADPELISEVSLRLGLHCKVSAVAGSYAFSVTSGGRQRCDQGRYISAAWMPAVISALGLSRIRGDQKFVPNVYLSACREDRLDMLRGLMDTDGWAEKHGSVRFTSSSERLAKDVQTLVRSLGGSCSIVKRQPYCTAKGIRTAGKIAYTCRIRHENAEEFFLLERKRIRAARGRNAKVSSNFVSIEPTGSAPTRCITVTHPSALYVTDDYIVTHNSSLGHIIALNAARAGVGVLEVSLEMSAMQLGRRALSAASGVPLFAMKTGHMTTDEGSRLVMARRELAGLPLSIDDAGGQTPAMIAAKARAAKRKHGLGLLMIDHLNLMKPEDQDAKHGGTWATGRASNTVLQIAKDCGCPVLLLAQLNRGPENRDDKRPMLADLRQAGDIEQDAYAVGFVYRPEYYLGGEPETKDGETQAKAAERRYAWQERKDRCAGTAEVIWQKVRDGETGVDVMRFDGPTTTFTDLDSAP